MKVNCITHFASIACVRFIKFAALDVANGNLVRPLVESVGGSDLSMELPSWTFWRRNHPAISHYLTEGQVGDVWHVHGEPNGLAKVLRQVNNRVAIVLNVHDAQWGLGGTATDDELGDLMAADHVIVPSEDYRRNMPTCKAICDVAISGVIGRQVVRGPRLGGILYEGGISVGGWRDYREIGKRLVAAGLRFQIFSPAANDLNIVDEYLKDQIYIEHHEYREMLYEQSRYDWALVAAPGPGNPAYATSWPNKYAEALQSGLPVLAYGISGIKSHIEQYGCGVYFDSIDDLVAYATANPVPSKEQVSATSAACESLSMMRYSATMKRIYHDAIQLAKARCRL